MPQPFAPRSYAPRHGYPTRKGPSGVLPFNVSPYIGLVDLLRTLTPFDRLARNGANSSYHMLSGSYFDYGAVLAFTMVISFEHGMTFAVLSIKRSMTSPYTPYGVL